MMAHRNRSRTGTEIAALPMRWGADGTLYILMVAAIGSDLWNMPKRWRLDGEKPWKTAEFEALDAAGVVGHVGPNPIGRYRYTESGSDGVEVTGSVEVFPMVVERLRRDWRDRNIRRRRWFEAPHAAGHVEDAELAELLRRLARKPARRTAMGRFFGGLF